MRRRISVLLATMLAAAGFAVLGPSQPAKAWVICGGTGTATVDDGTGVGILYPVGITSPSKTEGLVFDVLIGTGNPIYTFAFSFLQVLTVPRCVHTDGTLPPPGTADATGVVKGYCGLSSGSGTTAGGALFAWIGVGGTLVITGHLVGVVNATPNAPSQSCTHNGSLAAGALEFIITGAVVALNCFDTPTKTLETLVPITPHDFTTLIPVFTTQHLNIIFHVLVDIGIHFYWNHLCFGSPVLP